MFCPFCGIKNNAEQQSCFLCQKTLPSLDSETSKPRLMRTPARPPATPARLRERLLAVTLDLLLIAAILLVAGAALWSQIPVVRTVSLVIVIICAVSAAALIVFGYTWLFEEAFGSTLGKAFAGVRVVRREQPLSVARRAGVITFWLTAVAGAIWGAIALCHDCLGH